MSLEQLMSVIDQHKSEIPEGAYLELCNVAKAVHEAGAGAGPTENLFVVQYQEYPNIQLQKGFLVERDLSHTPLTMKVSKLELCFEAYLMSTIIIVLPNGPMGQPLFAPGHGSDTE